MHERLMLAPSTGKIVRFLRTSCCIVSVYMLLSFLCYHKIYVNQSSTLEGAIENQLLWSHKNPIY